jgi:hypothetical protein
LQNHVAFKEISTHGRNLPRQCNFLRNRPLSLLDRAVKVYIRDLLTEIGLRVDEFDQAVLDLQNNVRALADVLQEGTDCFEGEILASGDEELAGCAH